MWTILLSAGVVFGAVSADDFSFRHAFEHVHSHSPIAKRAETASAGYISPPSVGGNMYFRFEGQPDTKPEPINIIISGNSAFSSNNGSTDYAIFNSTGGFSQYLSALNFSDECLGLHLSTPAYANISGPNPELLDFLYRENFGEYPGGTCKETLVGGFHFRGWRQQASGAFFLAASQELNLTLKHDLVPNGYDLGRDEFVRRAALGGKDYYGCIWPPATITNITNLVKADAGGSTGMYNHAIGIDGIVPLVSIAAPNCGGNTTYTGKTWSTTVAPPRSSSSPSSSRSSGAAGASGTSPAVPINPPSSSKSAAVRVVILPAALTCILLLLLGVTIH